MLRDRAISPVELVEAHLRQIERLEPKLNAFVIVRADQAREEARLAEARAAQLPEDLSPAEQRRFPILPAYDLCLKCSHLFNLLDARGAISVTERVGIIARIRVLAVGVAKAYSRIIAQESHG